MNRLRALRLGGVVVVLVVAAFLAASALAARRSETTLPALTRQVLTAVNAFRAAHHLVPLRVSAGLTRSATQHSLQMGRAGYFAHNSANGTVFWRRIQRYYGSRGYAYWSVGENLLWAAPTVTAGRAMQMWIASPEHLRNLLAPRWREIGVSAVHVLHAPGAFHRLDVTIITTDFGSRR